MKMIIKKNAMNIYCCCVPEKVEIKRARPRTAIRKIAEPRNRRRMLPSKGMLKASFPIINPRARSISPIMKKGNHFGYYEMIFSYRCNIYLFNSSDLFFPYQVKSCKKESDCSNKYSKNSRQHIIFIIKHFIIPVPVGDLIICGTWCNSDVLIFSVMIFIL